jgi:hypothetical protein
MTYIDGLGALGALSRRQPPSDGHDLVAITPAVAQQMAALGRLPLTGAQRKRVERRTCGPRKVRALKRL